MVEKQTDAAQVEPIVTLHSAEWYRLKFKLLLDWLSQEERRAEDQQRQHEEHDLMMLASRNSGQASMAFRAQRWIDDSVLSK